MTFPENFIFPGFPGFPDPVGTLSNIGCTKCQNLTVSRLALELSLPNLLKPGFKSRMMLQLQLVINDVIARGASYIRGLTHWGKVTHRTMNMSQLSGSSFKFHNEIGNKISFEEKAFRSFNKTIPVFVQISDIKHKCDVNNLGQHNSA